VTRDTTSCSMPWGKHVPACKPILKPDGMYVSSELGPRAENLYLPLLTRVFGRQRVRFPFPVDIKDSLAQVGSLVEQGKFHRPQLSPRGDSRRLRVRRQRPEDR
jgi:hypothetical protein